jgi:bla regulator protein blaR1
MNPAYWVALANHLWQSTLFVGVVWLLTLAFRENRAAVRHRLWLAASVKFLLPFSLFASVGSYFAWDAAPTVSAIVETMSQPFTGTLSTRMPVPEPPSLGQTVSVPPSDASRIPAVLLSIWACGFAASLMSWLMGWMRLRRASKSTTRLNIDAPFPVVSCSGRIEPGVFGIFRPVLVMPEGITERLLPGQIQAVLAHELCHVRRCDNLTSAIHMVVEAMFWFHPLVWWIKARLIEEQERACDEEVLGLGQDPQVYAESILNICEFYVTSPLICVSGITGSDLKKRVAEIVNYRARPPLGVLRILVLILAIMAFLGPIALGMFHASARSALQANSPATRLQFEVASVRQWPAGALRDGTLRVASGEFPGLRCTGTDGTYIGVGEAPRGRCVSTFVGLFDLIFAAYVSPRSAQLRISGFPAEFEINDEESIGYQIQAVAPNPVRVTTAELQEMLQTLLRDRFHLQVHRETREIEGFRMVIAEGGIKFKETLLDEQQCCGLTASGQPLPPEEGIVPLIVKGRFSMKGLARGLPLLLMNERGGYGPPVADKTGLPGVYDITLLLDGIAPASDRGRGGGGGLMQFSPPIPKALEKQLGLRLQAARAPVDFLIIDHVEKSTEN